MALLTPPPVAPQRGDRTTFAARVDAFITWLINFVSELVALVAGLNTLAAGGAYSIPYKLLYGTGDIDPGTGNMRLNNATQNAATVLRLDTSSSAGIDVLGLLNDFVASSSTVTGTIRLQKIGDPSKWLTFNVTGMTQMTGYVNVSVVNRGGSAANPFSDTDPVMLFFQRTGDKGDTGSAGSLVTGIMHVNDTKAAGTSNGSPLNGTNVRTLNTVARNTIGAGASLASNQVTLPAGTYRVEGNAPAYGVGSHRAYLYNVTTPAVLVLGSSEGDNGSQSRSWVRSEFVLSASATLELRHWVGSTSGSLGNPTSSGFSEIYSELFFEKLA
jgi:hypothetical protein